MNPQILRPKNFFWKMFNKKLSVNERDIVFIPENIYCYSEWHGTPEIEVIYVSCFMHYEQFLYEPQIIYSELSTQIKRVTAIPPLDLSIQQIGLKIKLQMILYQINLLYISKEQYKEESISLDLVDQVIQYINTYLYEDINIDVLADKFSINKTSLNYFFRKKNGYTIHHYITLKRLLSVQLLVQQGKSVVDAAMSVGFQDYSTFYRQYKKHFGHSPKDEKTRKNL